MVIHETIESDTSGYIKGKDMVLSDFLSRQKTDDSNPHEIIPISFRLRRVLCENYYRLNDLTETPETKTYRYLVQMRSQAKSSHIKVPEVHGMDEGLIPHIRPEHQKSMVAPTTHPTPPICHTKPTPLTQPVDQEPPTHIGGHLYPSLELDKAELELEESLR